MVCVRVVGVSVDWSQFRDGDRVRVTFEGTWDEGDMFRFDGSGNLLHQHGYLTHATSAELIERPFTPPDEGTVFRNESLWISMGDAGFRLVRRWDGKVPRPGMGEDRPRPWSAMASEWLADIEVIAGV